MRTTIAQAEKAEIDVNVSIPTSSTLAGFSPKLSIIKGAGTSDVKIERRSIDIHPLDDFGPFAGPILLKLDVEGFEMSVLQGAARTLASTEVIISEISVRPRHERDVSLGTFLAYVESLGFSLIDIPELTPLHVHGPLAYIDAAFAKSNSLLMR
jgi:hypothetical protein